MRQLKPKWRSEGESNRGTVSPAGKQSFFDTPRLRQCVNKMSQKLSKNKVFLLFFCGFLIGICLEVVLIGNGRQASFRDSLKESINITCLVILKHQHLRYVNSSRKTWLRHCSDYRIVDIRRPPKSVENGAPKTTEAEKFREIVRNASVCSENGDVREVPARSAWGGLCKALHLVNLNRVHWLVIIPDSLLVLVENLKHFVRDVNWDEGHYYGYALRNYQADYNVLSAGILVSRGALRKLVGRFPREEDCEDSGKYWKNEDVYLGKYLKQMDILPKDSRDEEGRGRFHGYNMNNLLWPGRLFRQSEYSRKALYPVSQGVNCCSPFLITLDVSDPDSMHNLYFLLYKVKTFHDKLPPPARVNRTEGTFWKDFLRKEGYNESAIENMTNEEYYKIWEKRLPARLMYEEIRRFFEKKKESLD